MTSKIDSSEVNYAQPVRHHQTSREEKGKIEDWPSDSSKPHGNNQKRGVRKKTNKEELVRYMSNLPGYLQRVEKGENLQEKALNFGVLDWRHLENWKYNKKQLSGRSSMHSESTSTISSLFSPSGSSTLSSTSNNCSPSHQRKSSSSLGSYLNSSLKGHTQVAKPSKGDAVQIQNDKTLPENSIVEKLKLPRETHFHRRSFSEMKLEKGMKEDLDPKSVTKKETSSSKVKDEVLFDAKEKTKARVPDEIPRTQSKGKPAEAIKSTTKFPASKGRIPSSSHQSCVGLGKMSRDFSSTDGSILPQLDQTTYSAKSGPVKSEASAFSNNSNRENENGTSRARSSPLRRLLDPLLKPKAGNRFHSPKPIQEEPASTRRACKSANGRLGSYTDQPVSGPSKADGSHHVASTVQALLRVTEKGLPLFTFAVDNESDVLAASMRKISPNEKDDGSCIYTFYSVHEIKKKSGGWMNQRGKSKKRGYLSNIVGQMKVSSSLNSNLSDLSFDDLFMVKEFVLFGVELRQADQGVIDFKPSSEVAATVVKIPKGPMSRNHSYTDKKISEPGLTENWAEGRCSCKSEENLQNSRIVRNEILSSITVILPSGVHGLPSTGVPSPLIARWRSGGSCDCGGWDVGCKLRVLGDLDQNSQKLGSSEVHLDPDRIDLFSQGETQERRPIFSLSPFKKGIYSVVFSTSISTLQAFSICIAALNSKRLSHLSDSSVEKPSEGACMVVNDAIKREVPARYVSYPPHSPFGRV